MSDDFHERIRAIDIETTAAVKRAEGRERRAEQLERERARRLANLMKTTTTTEAAHGVSES